jgi:hypothetical protein
MNETIETRRKDGLFSEYVSGHERSRITSDKVREQVGKRNLKPKRKPKPKRPFVVSFLVAIAFLAELLFSFLGNFGLFLVNEITIGKFDNLASLPLLWSSIIIFCMFPNERLSETVRLWVIPPISFVLIYGLVNHFCSCYF